MKACRFLVLALSLVSLSCGSDSQTIEQSQDQSAANTFPVGTVAPALGILTSEQAGQAYLEIVNPVNCVYGDIIRTQNENSLGNGTVDPVALPELQALFKTASAAREKAVRDFLNNQWPAIVANDIELLARAWSKLARAELSISEAVDQGAYTTEMNGYNALDSSLDANPGYIRSALGIGPASETDNC